MCVRRRILPPAWMEKVRGEKKLQKVINRSEIASIANGWMVGPFTQVTKLRFHVSDLPKRAGISGIEQWMCHELKIWDIVVPRLGLGC